MVYRVSELQSKELINLNDGTKYGYITDLELSPEDGSVHALIIAGRPRLFGLLGYEPDVIFPWSAVRRIGPDIILVDCGQSSGITRL